MQVNIGKLEPAPVLVGFADLPRQGWRKPRHLSLRSDQVALSANGRGVQFHASGGEHPIDLELTQDAQALLVSREVDLSLDLSECHFKNGTGGLTLWAPVRFLSPAAVAASHPVARCVQGTLDPDTVREALEHCLSRGLAGPLSEVLREVSYEPGSDRLNCIREALSGLDRRPDVRRAMLECAGLELASGFLVLQAACRERDEEHDRQEAARECREGQRAQVEKTLTDMNMAEAVRRAKSKVQVQEILDEAERKKAELVTQQVILEGRLKERRILAEIEKIDSDRQEAVNRLVARQQALQEQIELFAHVIETLRDRLERPHEVEEPLALVATWNAYRRAQAGDSMPVLLRLAIPTGARLPSGTWLDVSVTVSREAYVYVLAKSSNGRWQRLVPDTDGIMGGLTRSNRQPANVQAVWPGGNDNPVAQGHENIPYWKLDDVTGWEHVLVAASVTEIDIEKLLNQDQTLKELRSRGAPLLTRGFTSGGSIRRSDAPTATGPDVRETRNCLVGDGCVVDEIVIEHY